MKKLLFDTDYPQWLMTTMGIAAAATVHQHLCQRAGGLRDPAIAVPGERLGGAGDLSGVPGAAERSCSSRWRRWCSSSGCSTAPWALILTYPTFLIPFCTWLLIGYFKSIPFELEECALIDGATRLQILRRITLPLAVPGLISAGIFAFTLSWNEFIYALAFIQSSEKKTVPVAVLTQLVQGDDYQWGSADGRGAVRVDPGGAAVLVLRGVLREFVDGGGEGVGGARVRIVAVEHKLRLTPT